MANEMRSAYRELSDGEKQMLVAVKTAGQVLFDAVEACGASRELSLAKTKAEEAVMWAVKHITK